MYQFDVASLGLYMNWRPVWLLCYRLEVNKWSLRVLCGKCAWGPAECIYKEEDRQSERKKHISLDQHWAFSSFYGICKFYRLPICWFKIITVYWVLNFVILLGENTVSYVFAFKEFMILWRRKKTTLMVQDYLFLILCI